MNIKEKIQELEQRLNDYVQIISIQSLERTPFIVEVGALNVGIDDKGVVILQNKNYPTQFSEKAVNIICSITFKDCNNKLVEPKVYVKYDWYSKQTENIRFTLSELKKLL